MSNRLLKNDLGVFTLTKGFGNKSEVEESKEENVEFSKRE